VPRRRPEAPETTVRPERLRPRKWSGRLHQPDGAPDGRGNAIARGCSGARCWSEGLQPEKREERAQVPRVLDSHGNDVTMSEERRALDANQIRAYLQCMTEGATPELIQATLTL